jgi:general secretion pathway protein G
MDKQAVTVVRAAARGQRGMTLLEIMIVLAIIALVMGFLVGPKVLKGFQQAQDKTTQMEIKGICDEAYPRWRIDNPGKNCPGSLKELAQYTNKAELKDPWGNEFIMLCGENAGEEIPNGFGVMSKGEDQKQGTEDDIKCWDSKK